MTILEILINAGLFDAYTTHSSKYDNNIKIHSVDIGSNNESLTLYFTANSIQYAISFFTKPSSAGNKIKMYNISNNWSLVWQVS